jgi:hypothetical protein
MSKREKARAHVALLLDPGEAITALANAKAKVPGSAVMPVALPAQVWVVVTTGRVLLFRDGRGSGRPLVDDLVFEASCAEIAVRPRTSFWNQVVVTDTASGEALVRLNLGMDKAAAAAVVDAAGRLETVEEAAVPTGGGVIDLRPGERLPDGRVLTASEWLHAVLDADARYR